MLQVKPLSDVYKRQVFTFPQVKLSIHALLSLNDKTIALAFPFLNKNGIEPAPGTAPPQRPRPGLPWAAGRGSGGPPPQ